MHRLKVLFCLVACMVVSCSDSVTQKNLEPRTIKPQSAAEDRVPGQYIITLKAGVAVEILQDVFAEFGLASVRDLAKGRYLITLEKDPGPEDITRHAATSSSIEYVQPNYVYRTMPPAQEGTQRLK